MKLLDDNIREVSSALSTYTHTSEDELDFKDKDLTSVLPVLVIKEEYRNSVEGVVVRADVQLFKDQVSNVLAKTNHPSHSGGCSHLLDDKPRYCKRVGNKKENFPKVTECQTLPSTLVTSTVEWKRYKHKKKVFELETHCQDKGMDIIVNRHPVTMSRLKTEFDALLLDLTLLEAFKHIMNNVTDIVTT